MAKKHAPEKKLSTKAKKLTLPPSSAGKKMTTKIPVVTTKEKVSDVRDLLFEHVGDFETINYIYIVSEKKVLKGVISIADVFKHPPETPVKKIMKKKLIKTHLKTDQERVAHMAIKEGLKAVPVVNDNNHLLGVVPSDEIQNILDAETKEDLYRLAGIMGSTSHFEGSQDTPSTRAFLGRVPWILIGLIGGLLTARVIGLFEGVLEENLILAGFIPLVAYVANAVGVQTQTLYIRDLATQGKISFFKYSSRQLVTSTLLATTCWLFIWLLATFIWNNPFLGIVVGLAVFAAILVATFFALFIPYLLINFDFDPAIGSGPFTTIIQDLLSIIIYFSIASALL